MDRLQNRRFVRGVDRFSWHVTKCHAYQAICTLSPLRAALTIRFTESTQHDTSKVLRLLRKMTSEGSKVLRLPRKMQHIFWKCSKSIAPARQNDFLTRRETCWNATKCHACHTKGHDHTFSHVKSHVFATFPIGTATLRPRRSQTDGCKRLRTVANVCGRLRTVADARSRVTRTRVNPQTPKCKTRTFRYAFGKKIQVDF